MEFGFRDIVRVESPCKRLGLKAGGMLRKRTERERKDKSLGEKKNRGEKTSLPTSRRDSRYHWKGGSEQSGGREYV